MLTSHILMVLSLEPDSRKGPGLPLFLVCLHAKKKIIIIHLSKEICLLDKSLLKLSQMLFKIVFRELHCGFVLIPVSLEQK